MTLRQLPNSSRAWIAALAIPVAALALAACGGGGGGSSPPPASDCQAAQSFSSTFEGIQKMIFEKHGCTQDVCHGSGAQGGLNLSPDVAYDNLIEVPSASSQFPRVLPGDKDRSFLFLKLAAKTNPGTVEIAGAPMPNGLPALSADELELVRLWIYNGAPKTGTVRGTETLLNACLPAPEPITIKPLDPPAPSEGVQFAMPPWLLTKQSEHEVCFASYYDFTDQVPAEYKDPSGKYFRFQSQELRQDPQSHHLILNLAVFASAENLHDPSYGEWTCKGGPNDGQACEPTDLASCGDGGLCGSQPKDGFACVGYGPPTGGVATFQIGGAQQAQFTDEFFPGIFAQIPLRGVLYWNSHAFNLTDQDHLMHARLNYLFAKSQQKPVQSIFDVSHIFSANAPPYTTQTLCADHVLPQGARLYNLTSHTHKHGKHFTVTAPDGSEIYASSVYNDPVNKKYDPPLVFDSTDAAQRTLHYCSLYNNGVNDDGSPNPDAVTRASKVPVSAQQTIGRCKPTACTAGKVGEACNGTGDDATCDTSAGASDGECDACRITGGESTENEMFILIGEYFLGEAPQATAAAASAGGLEAARSDYVGIALPPGKACTSSAGGHAAHAMHAAHGG